MSLLRPSRSATNKRQRQLVGRFGKRQIAAYQGISGAYPDPAGNPGQSFPGYYGGYFCGNGMLIPNEVTSIASAIDGTSNVIIVAEQSAAVGGVDIRNGYYSPWAGRLFLNAGLPGGPGV